MWKALIAALRSVRPVNTPKLETSNVVIHTNTKKRAMGRAISLSCGPCALSHMYFTAVSSIEKCPTPQPIRSGTAAHSLKCRKKSGTVVHRRERRGCLEKSSEEQNNNNNNNNKYNNRTPFIIIIIIIYIYIYIYIYVDECLHGTKKKIQERNQTW
eukprot:gene5869-4189_t